MQIFIQDLLPFFLFTLKIHHCAFYYQTGPQLCSTDPENHLKNANVTSVFANKRKLPAQIFLSGKLREASFEFHSSFLKVLLASLKNAATQCNKCLSFNDKTHINKLQFTFMIYHKEEENLVPLMNC